MREKVNSQIKKVSVWKVDIQLPTWLWYTGEKAKRGVERGRLARSNYPIGKRLIANLVLHDRRRKNVISPVHL